MQLSGRNRRLPVTASAKFLCLYLFFATQPAFFIEGCERDCEEMPRPDMPLTVGIDGGYVDSCEQKGKKGGRFEVIVGKSMTAEGESKCFGLVDSYDTKPKRRVFEALKSQGMQMNQ